MKTYELTCKIKDMLATVSAQKNAQLKHYLEQAITIK